MFLNQITLAIIRWEEGTDSLFPHSLEQIMIDDKNNISSRCGNKYFFPIAYNAAS